MDRLTVIDHQLAALAAEKQALLARQAAPFPRQVQVTLQSNKEVMWTLGAEMGLEEEACRMFRYAACEVVLEMEVQRDGTARIVGVDGHPLAWEPQA